MNLYVATYQLHATLDPAEVQATIAEIAINLLGADQFVLLLRKDDAPGCDIALVGGTSNERRQAHEIDGLYGGEIYAGGDSVVEATLSDRALRLGPTADSEALDAGAPRGQN